MTDVFDPRKRSEVMSRIRGADTGPELALRRALWAAGHRYRLNSKLTGRPDIVFPRQRVAVFVDGCFWHGCPEHAVKPKTNSDFWSRKLAGNIERDGRVNAGLENQGWRVVRIWEHEIEADVNSAVLKIAQALAGISKSRIGTEGPSAYSTR
jgi:DNA mismatch endonuclease (patch repair protein)